MPAFNTRILPGVSVALCTFNGERFLQEQLTSIAAQSRLPDELVVRDDASTDATVSIIKAFAKDVPFDVRLAQNSETLGVGNNFASAIADCRYDLIALCDQDDVWLPEKLERQEAALRKKEDAAFTFSDGVIVDATLQPLGRTLWSSRGFTVRRQRSFETRGLKLLLTGNVVTGATMVFRSAWRDRLLPVPAEWNHDAWFALLLSTLAGGIPVDRVLIKYRQHDEQQIGIESPTRMNALRRSASTDSAFYERAAARSELLKSRLLTLDPSNKTALAIANVEQKIQHLKARARIRGSGLSIHEFVRELGSGRYFRFSQGWRSVAQDLIRQRI